MPDINNIGGFKPLYKSKYNVLTEKNKTKEFMPIPKETSRVPSKRRWPCPYCLWEGPVKFQRSCSRITVTSTNRR